MKKTLVSSGPDVSNLLVNDKVLPSMIERIKWPCVLPIEV
jgi:hypothetical protein